MSHLQLFMLLRRLSEFFLDILEVVVFAIAIFLFIYLLVLQPHKIKGTSMEPNFPNGEYLLTDKLTYRFREPERGDVIVFVAPQSDGEEFIKRIIGLPGETITIRNNKVYINGTQLTESYIPVNITTGPGPFLGVDEPATVPADNYFVLGDNRVASSDSRVWGFVTKEKISGRAWIVYWPPPSVGLIESVTYSSN
jgi:signal peptidase I